MLAASPDTADAHTARELALAARRQGHEVDLFLNADGVASAAALADLARQGVRLSACSLSARQRGVPPVEGIVWGSQLEWAEAVREADRVLVLA